MDRDFKFWQEYEALVLASGISAYTARWHIRRVKSFEKALPAVPLEQRTEDDLRAYLEMLSRRGRHADWQLEQINDALRLMYEKYLAAQWARPWPFDCLTA